jgi:branched-chain amino acid transport system substrate-binding protein
VAGLGLAATMMVAACSSSGTDTHETTGGASDAGTASVAPLSAKPAGNGTPLKIFFFNDEGASSAAPSPEGTQAAKAAVQYINKNLGGINGRPVSIEVCASLGTQPSVINCANKAVDAKPAVVIKGVDSAGPAAVPIVTSAGIPYLTNNASDAEIVNPMSFVPAPGYAGQYSTLAEYAKSKGMKAVSVIYSNVSALSNAAEGPLKKAFGREGIDYSTEPVDITTADLTPAYSAALSRHPDAIITLASVPHCASVVKARQALSDKTPLALSYDCNTDSVLKAVSADSIDGTLIAFADTSALTSDPDTQTYLQVMKTYAPSASTGGFAPTAFESVMDFYRAMLPVSDPSTLDAKTTAKALAQSTDVPLFMGDGKTFSCGKDLFKTAPSVCDPWGFLAQYSGGKLSLVGSYDSSVVLKGLA